MKVDRYRFLILVLIALVALGSLLPAQQIDQRVWSMSYWQKLAEKGLVPVAKQTTVPDAVYTGSRIVARTVLVDDSPDVPVINATNTTQSENSIFVNPLDNNKALNSNNSTPFPVSGIYGSSGFMTDDFGLTWGGSVQGTGGSNSGDPAACIDLNGRYYVGYIAADDGQGVAYSTNEGQTWTHVQAGPGGFILDKNHLWVDNSPTSPYSGNLYDAWTNFQGGANDSEIEIVRSTDGGLTWSAPLNISSAVNAGSHNQGVNISTGPNGEVYVTWSIYDAFPADETALGFTKSTDGGVTFQPATRIISNIRGIRTSETSKNHRVNSFPSMDTDISGGSRNGWIYIVWANIGVPGTNVGPDIDNYIIRSTDGGASWSTPVRINQDPSGLGKEHYFPWITCDPVTGNLSVVSYDDRNVSSTMCEVFVANSLDGGTTWEDFKVSDVAFTPSPIPGLAGGYMGDYLGISARGGKVYPVWTDNRTGNALTYVSPFALADPTDPNPPESVSAYSDYTTPTSIALTWTDPTTLANGDTLLPSEFQINILRDDVPIDSVAGGTEQYTDNGLTDGVLYSYTLFTKIISNDSTSLEASVLWYAGGSPMPAPPANLVLTADTAEATLDWTDPTTQSDGTPLDDLDSLLVYRDGVHIASVVPGVETYMDAPPPGFVYTYTVKAKDNESPPNLSAPSNEASGFVGTTPDYLVWVGPDAVGSSAASGDSLFAALLANGESTFLTNDLFEFGSDLSIYEAVFVVLGIYSDNHVLGSSDPEAAAMETYLQNGGRLFLEGGDCFNYDPETGGYNIRPWFDLADGPDGSADLFGVVGLNDLSTFSFTYSGSNSFMDELQPINSTLVWQNNANPDISGVFNVYGSARTIGVVPSFGGFDNSSAASNAAVKTGKTAKKEIVENIPKVRIHHERNEKFVKKAGYYPELKQNRKSDRQYFEITPKGVHILANNKVELMAAYLAYFQATPGSPVIALSDTVYNDTLLVGNTTTETLTITNNSGTLGGELTYSIAENPEVTWLSVMPVAGTLTANQSEDITLSIDASGLTAGDYTTTLDITSNDPVNPLVTTVVNLQANAAPVIRVEPDTVEMTVDPGSVDSTIFTIHNDGAGPLQIYSIQDEEINSQGKRRLLFKQKQQPAVQHAKGEQPPSNGEQTEGAGGPDPFGYKWIDSDEPGGPPYVYTDISGTGTIANLQPTGIFDPKDEGQATINLPWDVKFYGNSYNQLQVNSNGFVTFDLVFFDVAYSNTGLPSSTDPNLMVCAFWDDLDGSAPGATREIYYQQVGNKFIIQWHNWGYYPAGTENLDFQIVLFQSSSTIWLAYENIVDQGLSTVGIENVDGTVGLQIAYNELYAHNQLLTKITLGADWLTQTPTSGTVAPGDSLEVTLKADATFLTSGNYTARVIIDSNDPVNATLGEPIVNLQVGEGAAAISVTPASLDFDSTKVGEDSTLSMMVENVGSDTLEVSNILITNAAFSVNTSSFMVLPSGMQEVQVTFAPLAPGPYSGTLRIASNDPMHDTLDVALSGYGVQVTGIAEGEGLPQTFAVSPNYPNPFNPTTTIKYQLPQTSDVRLVIYNVLGQAVRTLVNARMEAGYHSAEWDGRNEAGAQVASGIYIYRFQASDFLKVQKMILMK